MRERGGGCERVCVCVGWCGGGVVGGVCVVGEREWVCGERECVCVGV